MAKNIPSPLDAASDRLSEAFYRLEHAVQTRRPGVMSAEDLENLNDSWSKHCEALEADIQTLRADNDALREENSRLSNELNKVQQDYLELRKASESVAKKLDKKAQQLELLA